MRVTLVASLVVCLVMSVAAQEDRPSVRLWDTGKAYTQKRPLGAALGDKENWTLVPYGTTDYTPRGDLMLESDRFYVFLFTNKQDSISLAAKYQTGGVADNEIYKVHEKGLRNFGHGTMAVKILKNTAQEIMVEHAGEGRRHGTPQPIVTTYRILAGKPWLEVKPVELVNQQGMHGKSRICAFVKQEGEDFILDAKRETYRGDDVFWAPRGTIGIINFARVHRSGHDLLWFMTFPPGAERHKLTYLGFHSDRFWEDATADSPSVGAQYAYLGEGGVFIGVLNDKDNWKREDIWREIRDGETYTSEFKAPYAGKWKVVARLENRFIHSLVEMDAGEAFSFTPPKRKEYEPDRWHLDYLLVYLWDRTDETPQGVWTPMDVYQQVIEGREQGGR